MKDDLQRIRDASFRGFGGNGEGCERRMPFLALALALALES